VRALEAGSPLAVRNPDAVRPWQYVLEPLAGYLMLAEALCRDGAACAEAGLVLVAFDRATLPWHAGQVLRAGANHGGLVLFRRTVRSTDYGYQSRLLTRFWTEEGQGWDWLNRIVYLPKSTLTTT